MYRKVVGSREYKVMLNAAKFSGNEDELLGQATAFWSDFVTMIDDHVVDVDGKLDDIKKNRTIQFLDTATCQLRSNSYVFRERIEIGDDEPSLTLKYRHPDRYIAQDRNMDADDGQAKRIKTKFEQDLKLPYKTLYSFSTTLEPREANTPKTMGELGTLFPALAKDMGGFNGDDDLVPVADFKARELVIGEPTFQVNESPRSKVECVLVVWYDHADADGGESPILVEFSFKYEDPDENFDHPTSQRMYDIFLALGTMENWVEPGGRTKTNYVYCLGDCGCM